MKGTRNKAEVLVAGAGPAGCSAAIHLARAGAKVTLVDRCAFPRTKVCGGLLTPAAKTLAEELLQMSLADGLKLTASSSYEIRKRLAHIRRIENGPVMYAVNRDDFDYELFKTAKNSAIDILEGSSIEELDLADRTARLTGGSSIRFDFLIGADGVNSLVGRRIGKAQDKKLVATAYQTELPLELAKRAGIAIGNTVILGYVGYGWGWSFEKAGHVTVGLAGLGIKGGELRNRFQGFLSDFCISPQKERLKLVGSLVPFGSFLKNPALGRVLLAGDAAGFADPITGEGIQYALLSGKLAAMSITGETSDAAKEYVLLCSRLIIPELGEARRVRPFIFNRLLQPSAIKILLKNERCMAGFIHAVAGETTYGRAIMNAIIGGG